MTDADQGRVDLPGGRESPRPSLKDEHALLLREVEARAIAVTSEADRDRWPQTQLRELLNYLHLEVLRQVVEEEWLLFRLIRHVPDQLGRLRAEHLELREAIEVLDQAAATAGQPAGLTPAQLSATTRDLLARLEAHFSAEDTLAIGNETAPATATFGAQPHEWYVLTERAVIDLDQLPGQKGTDAALDRLLRLRGDEHVQIRSAYDPSPLCRRLTATDPGRYGVTYLERGPDSWRVEITRRADRPAPQAYP
jgi:uncharacterized protein (DUF2249 family)